MRILLISGVEMGWHCAKAMLNKTAGLVSIFSLPESFSNKSGYIDFSPLGKAHGIDVQKFEDINCPESISRIKEINPDLILVIGWSGIIGEEILKIPKKGVVGHHPTLLPKHRGNAPIPWTIINGLTKSGVTFFYLEKKIDAGDILGQREFDISLEEDASAVYAKATDATVSLLLDLLPRIGSGSLKTMKQDQKKASRWGKRRPEDGIIDWNCMTVYLYNWVRGLTHPYPGAFTYFNGKKLFIWKASIAERERVKPGELLSKEGRVLVGTGDGALILERVQLEGEEEMLAQEFSKKHQVKESTFLG